MMLEQQVCSRARLTRDPRFDGKFFIGVRSTKIYCRSICPVPTVKEKNVLYFPSAAAAAEAGFRPCLRCRPECSPGTPAWSGTSNTVSRALRLIVESGLQEGGVDGLAERLGVGSRHLRRLFIQHLGAPPRAIANTRRLHFAKKLIDETALPMSDVAIVAGFGCVRRFNHAIRNTYDRTPTQIRRLNRQRFVHSEDRYSFRLGFRPPYHWKGMLGFLAARAIPGVEAVDAQRYARTFSVNGRHGSLEVSMVEGSDELAVNIHIDDPHSLYSTIEKIRRMFDLSADWMAIAHSLKADPALALRLRTQPGLRVPGCWDGFELATRAILGQQITVKAATTFAGRIARTFGTPVAAASGLTHLFPGPEVLAQAGLTVVGLTEKRAEAIRALARAVCDGHISFERVVHADELIAKLVALPGIGPWTAQYVAMRALGEPDALPTADLALLRALGLTPSQLQLRAEAWRPWRSYATMYLWSTA